MRILQVIRQYLPSTGGMETYVANLCRQLGSLGHRSDVATLDYLFKSHEPLPAYQRIDGTDVIRLPSLGTARYFFAPRLLQALPRYDIIHVHGVDFFVDLLGGCRRWHGTPVVLSTHGGFFHTAWGLGLKQIYFQTATRMALRGVDRVIASSPQDQELFARITANLELVENGIDYQNFATVEKTSGGQELLFIGRLSKNKRVDRLLRAFARARQSCPQATLTVIGPDWEGLGDGLQRLAHELGLDDAVHFAGVVSQTELLAALARARLFVSATEYEAFGLSTVEAMASGTVPLVSDIPAFAALIEEGASGFLTDFADEQQAAAAITAALSLPAELLAAIGAQAQRAAARYDWRQVAGEIVAIYEQVAGQEGGR